MKYILLSILLFLALLAARSEAQIVTSDVKLSEPNSRPAFGAFADANLSMAHANFSQLPGVPECNVIYQSGIGIGPAFGIFYELPLQNNFSILLRGVYDRYGEKITSNEQTPIALGGVQSQVVIEHGINATLGMIGFQPMANYHITNALAIHLGCEIGYVIQSSFAQIETLTQPTTSGVFENGLRTRNAQSGKLPNSNPIVASLIGGISYHLALNKSNSMQLVPEISYAIGLTPVIKNLSWSVNSIHGGVGIRYEIPEKPVGHPKPLQTDTIVPPPHIQPPIASIVANGVEANGEEKAAAIMRVEEIYSSKMTPLLPYIFFDEHSQILPPRYKRIENTDAAEFDEKELKHSDAMEINHQTLNVIGKRLQENPDATITLAGITVNKSKSAIDKKLALARAETITDYLATTWNISKDRIRIISHALSEGAVVALDSDGIAEVNRVEIASNAFDIMKPVMGNDTIRNVTPPVIRFRPSINYAEVITSWNIDITQDGKNLKSFAGTQIPPTSLDWILADDQKSVPKFPGKIDYLFSVTGSHNDRTSVSGSLDVEQISLRKKKIERMADREIEKFNLLLFDLQSSELNQTNKQIIDLIQKNLNEFSTITIVGHTDRTGETEKNKKLSFERAKSTAKALGVNNAAIRGIANETILYDNSLPEGRCLSRTVDIIVETPTDTQ